MEAPIRGNITGEHLARFAELLRLDGIEPALFNKLHDTCDPFEFYLRALGINPDIVPDDDCTQEERDAWDELTADVDNFRYLWDLRLLLQSSPEDPFVLFHLPGQYFPNLRLANTVEHYGNTTVDFGEVLLRIFITVLQRNPADIESAAYELASKEVGVFLHGFRHQLAPPNSQLAMTLTTGKIEFHLVRFFGTTPKSRQLGYIEFFNHKI